MFTLFHTRGCKHSCKSPYIEHINTKAAQLYRAARCHLLLRLGASEAAIARPLQSPSSRLRLHVRPSCPPLVVQPKAVHVQVVHAAQQSSLILTSSKPDGGIDDCSSNRVARMLGIEYGKVG